MLDAIRRNLSLYLLLLKANIRSQTQYRVSFLMDVLSTGFGNGAYFLGIVLIFQRFEHIEGWGLGEVAFLAGMAEMAFATMDLVFSGFDQDRFSPLIRLGRFDQIMLRPVSLIVQVFGSAFILRRVGRFIEGLVIFSIALQMVEIQWSIWKILYLPVIYISLVISFGALFVCSSGMIFWTVQPVEAFNIFTYGGNELVSYPMHIYPRWLRNLFTYLVPLIFMNYYPALYILDKPDPFRFPIAARFLAPFLALLMLFLAFRFWKFGVEHYQSTGS